MFITEKKGVKVICILLIMSILISIVMPLNIVRAEDVNLKISMQSSATELKAGGRIEVEIYLELFNSTQVDNIGFGILYDQNILKFDEDEGFYNNDRSTRFSTSPTTSQGISTEDPQNRMLLSVNPSRSNYLDADGLMYTIYFDVLQDANSTTLNMIGVQGSCATADTGLMLGEDSSLTIPYSATTTTYTITYNSNTSDSVSNMPGNDTKTQGTPYAISSTEPTRTGYKFKEWNTDASGSGTSYALGDPYTTDADLTLYAQWDKLYTLTVNPNGGTWESSSSTQTFTGKAGDTKEIPNPTATPLGNIIRYDVNGGDSATKSQDQQYTTFSGWDNPGPGNLSGTTYTYGANDETLTAQYTGDNVILPEATRNGYDLAGWYTAATGGTFVGLANATYAPTYNPTNAPITLYAQWTPKQYILTIDPNGGTHDGNTTSQNYTQDFGTTKTINDPIAPSGHTVTFDSMGGDPVSPISITTTFSGWATSGSGTFNTTTSEYTYGAGNGTLTANYTADPVTLPSIVNKTGATFLGWSTDAGGLNMLTGTTYTPGYNTSPTLYAQWTAQSATITLDPGEGKLNSGEETLNVTYGQSYGTLPTPVRLGYDFNGWYDSTGKEITSGSTVESFSDLTAQWTIKTPTLTINPNGGTHDGNTTSQGYTQNYGTIKIINDPIAPHGNEIVFDTRGGDPVTSITQTTTFSGWTGATVDASTKEYEFGENDETITANYTADPVILPTATKSGANFLGWYTATTGGDYVGIENDTYNPDYTRPDAPITLYAQWQEAEYDLTINPNGGTWRGSSLSQTLSGGYNTTVNIENPTTAPTGNVITLERNDGTGAQEPQIIQTQHFTKWTQTKGVGTLGTATSSGTSYTYGTEDETITANYMLDSVTLPNIDGSRPGYNFDGWYTSATGGVIITGSYAPTNNITLYAHWTPKTYTITFDPVDGTLKNGDATKTVTYGETYGDPTGTLPTAEKTGYTFDGWYIGNTKITASTTVDITTNTTLTARYIADQYTLTIDPNGGTHDGNTTSQTYTQDFGTTKTINNPVAPAGYTITLDYNDGTSRQDTKTQTQHFTNWTLTETNTGTIIGTVNGTYTYSAQDETITANYEREDITLPDLSNTRTGYDFNGWFTLPTGGTNVGATYKPVSDNETLYAQWTAKTYTITFDPGTGATVSETSRTKAYGEAYGTLPTPNKTGYDFDAWYDESGNKVDASTTVKGDVTLTARYNIKQFTVTFKNDDGSTLYTTTANYGTNIHYPYSTPEKQNVPNGYESTFTGWDQEAKLQNITENLELTAQYTVTPKVYTITYNNLKGADNSHNPQTYTISDGNIPLASLLDQGEYIFKGWYIIENSTQVNITSIDTSKLENLVVYAEWENDKLYLHSDKYKIGENDIDNYEQGDVYLDKIEPETTVRDFMANCDTNGIMVVLDQNGRELGLDDYVGTKMTLKDTRYDEKIELILVVMGDVTGDGKVQATDLSTLNNAILGDITITNTAEFKALDLNDTLTLTATDLSTEVQAILGLRLTYTKPSRRS